MKSIRKNNLTNVQCNNNFQKKQNIITASRFVSRIEFNANCMFSKDFVFIFAFENKQT